MQADRTPADPIAISLVTKGRAADQTGVSKLVQTMSAVMQQSAPRARISSSAARGADAVPERKQGGCGGRAGDEPRGS